MNKSIFIFSIY